MLQCFVTLATRSIRLDLLKPLIQETEFTGIQLARDGSLVINNARFKTRVRKNVRRINGSPLCGRSACILTLLLDVPSPLPEEWGYRHGLRQAY